MQIRDLKLQANNKQGLPQDAQLFACCRTAATHIQQVRMWFSSTADQSIDSISLQLQRLCSGNFHLKLHHTNQTQAIICVKYKVDTSADALEQCLDEQGLTDLVKRLYLDQQDASTAGGPSASHLELDTFNDKVTAFLQLYQVCVPQ